MVALICIVVIGSAAITTSLITIGQIREEYEYMLNEARQEMNENKKTVFVAVTDIKTGDILSEEMVEKRVVYTSQPIESYITKDELGKAVIIDIPEGTHILKGMVAENSVTSVLREVEYDVIHISSNIEASDFVDVRIFYPNGESFVVLSKKQLKGYQPDMPICYLWVDEEELLRMSAAIVDAGLYEGSKLFMTKYIEPNIQEASVITYTPSISVLSLIEHDPNIVERCSQLLNKEVRKALENRLAESLDLDVKEIYWDIDGEIRYMPEVLKENSYIGIKTEGTDTDKTDIDRTDISTNEINIVGYETVDNKIDETDDNYNHIKVSESLDNTPENNMAGIITDGHKDDLQYKYESNDDNNDEINKKQYNNPELGQLYDEEYFIATEG